MNRLLLSIILTLAPVCSGQILRPILGGTTATVASNPWITGVMTGTARNDFDGCVGVDFTPSTNLTVTSLGRWVISGNSQMHTIYILDYITPFATIVSGTVDTSGATPGQYLYVSVTPTVLTSGHKYSVVSTEAMGADQFYNDTDTTITTTADAVDDSSVYVIGVCLGTQHENTAAGHRSYVPPNFKYQ